jgi:hypothetical protein
MAIDDKGHAELLNELRDVRREIDSIPKKWELRLVAYVILGAVGSIFIFRDLIGGSSFCIDGEKLSPEAGANCQSVMTRGFPPHCDESPARPLDHGGSGRFSVTCQVPRSLHSGTCSALIPSDLREHS